MRTQANLRIPSRGLFGLAAGISLVYCGLLSAGCAGPDQLVRIGDGPLGNVALERLSAHGTTARFSGPSGSFQASHPADVSSTQVRQLLSGLYVAGVSPAGSLDGPQDYPLLSGEEVEFLAPLVVKALAEAEPSQRVTFAVKDDGLVTDGTLYLYKNVFRVALAHYRTRSKQPDAKLSTYRLTFQPSQAVVAADQPQSWMIIEPNQPRVAVAAEALSRLQPITAPVSPAAVSTEPHRTQPTATAAPVSPQVQQELQAAKDVVVKQAEELQQLKSELQRLKQQLAEKDAAKTKPKPAPKKTPPQP